MRALHPQPIKARQGDFWDGVRDPLGIAYSNDWMWPQKTHGCCIVSCKEHGPETWDGAKNKPTRGKWWPVLIDGVWYWGRQP